MNTTTRFGAGASIGVTYTNIGTVPSSTTWNLILNITNRTASAIKIRAFIATASWASGEPSGSTLVAAMAYDTVLTSGQVMQIPFIVLNVGEKIVVYSNTANGADFIADGIAIT